MLDRLVLSDAQWARMAPLVAGRSDTRGATGRDNRLCHFERHAVMPPDARLVEEWQQGQRSNKPVAPSQRGIESPAPVIDPGILGVKRGDRLVRIKPVREAGGMREQVLDGHGAGGREPDVVAILAEKDAKVGKSRDAVGDQIFHADGVVVGRDHDRGSGDRLGHRREAGDRVPHHW